MLRVDKDNKFHTSEYKPNATKVPRKGKKVHQVSLLLPYHPSFLIVPRPLLSFTSSLGDKKYMALSLGCVR